MPRSWTDQDLQKIARMMRGGKSATDAPSPLNVTIKTRGSKQCAWPVSDTGEHMLMCGHDTGDILNSYCPHHHARAYQPRQSMKVAA